MKIFENFVINNKYTKLYDIESHTVKEKFQKLIHEAFSKFQIQDNLICIINQKLLFYKFN